MDHDRVVLLKIEIRTGMDTLIIVSITKTIVVCWGDGNFFQFEPGGRSIKATTENKDIALKAIRFSSKFLNIKALIYLGICPMSHFTKSLAAVKF